MARGPVILPKGMSISDNVTNGVLVRCVPARIVEPGQSGEARIFLIQDDNLTAEVPLRRSILQSTLRQKYRSTGRHNPQRDGGPEKGLYRLHPIALSQELLSRLCRAAGSFPGMPCYEPFVALQKSVFVPLVVFLHSHLGTKTGLYYIDSTALATIIALPGTRCLPIWPNAARWAGSSASSCTLSSTTTMKSSP